MKRDTIKTGSMPATAMDSARIGGNDTANLPNDFGKSRKKKIMGGFGSGRGQYGKDTTIDMRALDVRRLQRDGLLLPGRSFNWQWSINGEKVADINIRVETCRVILSYRSRSNGGEWQPMEYTVILEWTPCPLGGRRPWFLCPARGCGRRAAILFGGSIFACRYCHRLAYASQRERADDRAIRRADRLREQLKWEPGILNGDGGKPKGMHWRTYERLIDQHDAYVEASLAGVVNSLRDGRINTDRD